jgi:AraC family cel operon transcriptional repressor
MTFRLHYKDVLSPGQQVHLTRAVVTPSRPKSLHDHDYFELFWVQNGIIRHHTPSGMDRLEEGDLVLMLPGQAHAVQGKGENAMIVSICIHPDVVDAIQHRYPALLLDDTAPIQTRRNIKQLAALNQAALTLEASALDGLAAEAFLLPLLAGMHQHQAPKDAPIWLARAIEAAHEKEVFSAGAAGFVAQTGRAHAHVSRTMRKVTGQSPSEFINSMRMNYAARALTTDNEPVSLIAADCGIPNMAHFHKLFRAHHNKTPLQYRQQFQRNVIQPK